MFSFVSFLNQVASKLIPPTYENSNDNNNKVTATYHLTVMLHGLCQMLCTISHTIRKKKKKQKPYKAAVIVPTYSLLNRTLRLRKIN